MEELELKKELIRLKVHLELVQFREGLGDHTHFFLLAGLYERSVAEGFILLLLYLSVLLIIANLMVFDKISIDIDSSLYVLP